MADSCLMQRSIMVSFRKVPLNDKNRPFLDSRCVVIQRRLRSNTGHSVLSRDSSNCNRVRPSGQYRPCNGHDDVSEEHREPN